MKSVYTLDDLKAWKSGLPEEEGRPVKLGVFGDPVQHSASPAMQNAALDACGISSRYVRIHVRPEEFRDALRAAREAGMTGVNTTLPHKFAALENVDHLDDGARRLGAVNTVIFEGESSSGFNTDGPGLVRAVRQEFSVDLRDLRVMILGAGGGAGSAIAAQCVFENCERVVLVNRTVEKAAALKEKLSKHLSVSRLLGPFDKLAAIPWSETAIRHELEAVDLIINASTIGMKRTDPPALPGEWLTPYLMVYDTIYVQPNTRLMTEALNAGARVANGASMLVHQGALAFEIWFNRPAPVDVMRKALEEFLAKRD